MDDEYRDRNNDIQIVINGATYELELLPDGWVDSFVSNLRKELAETIGSYAEYFKVLQIKEKYGMLRFYWGWADKNYDNNEVNDLNRLTNEVEEIIRKYEKISAKTCVVCGKSATKMTTGWIMPVCAEHEYL